MKGLIFRINGINYHADKDPVILLFANEKVKNQFIEHIGNMELPITMETSSAIGFFPDGTSKEIQDEMMANAEKSLKE